MLEFDNNNNFNALLKNDKGEILSEGRANVDIENKCVNFQSEFVPLYPIETKLEVVRLFENQEVHRFYGRVYLSDRKLMRLTHVDDELLEGSELCYSNNFHFQGLVCNLDEQATRNKWKIRIGKKENKKHEYTARVIDMTCEKISFYIDEECFKARQYNIEEGHRFLLSIDEMGKSVIAEVSKAILFGDYPQYICNLSYENEETRDFVRKYLLEQNHIINKLF